MFILRGNDPGVIKGDGLLSALTLLIRAVKTDCEIVRIAPLFMD